MRSAASTGFQRARPVAAARRVRGGSRPDRLAPPGGRADFHHGLLGLVFLVLTAAAPAGAHDVWLEPAAFAPEPGATVAVRILVGDRFEGEPVPRNPRRIARLVAVGPEAPDRAGASAESPGALAQPSVAGLVNRGLAETPLPGVDGVDPAGFLRPAASGLHLLAYVSTRAPLTLPAEKFERYLREEGLERVVEERARAGRSREPGREVYSRCAKSLVAVGGGGGEAYRHLLGCPFELVAESDPYALAAGGELGVRVLVRGEPLAGVLVVALPGAAPEAAVRARSDAAGRVVLPLDRPGVWLVKAVHMEKAPPGLAADWESWWASLTFAVPAG